MDGTSEGAKRPSGSAESVTKFAEEHSKELFVLATILIILVTIYFRVPMLQYYGFYEPDGYFHYSVIRAAVNNGFSIPQINPLSGWPPSCNNANLTVTGICGPAGPHHEPFGLYWVTIIPYLFLQFVGVSYYDIFRIMPVLFGIFDVILAYFLARSWSKDKFFGILVMLLIALNMGNAARTSALIYRGDSFVTPFFLAALIGTVMIFKTEDKNKKVLLALLSGLALALCNLVWSGAAFATAIYIFSLVMMLMFGFSFDKKNLVRDSGYMLIALFSWYLIVALFKGLMWIVSIETFTGLDFFMLFVPIVLSWYIADHLTNRRAMHLSYMDTPAKRFAISLGAVALVFVLIYLIIPGFVYDIFSTGGFEITTAFSSTIQELQPPTYAFLFASFNFQNFTNPMSIIMVISTYLPQLTLLMWMLLLVLFVPYLFMHVEGSDRGILSGNARWHFEFNETTLILISYFALTAYLQMSAIRFNSLVSIPMSIFSAFTIYWLVLFLKRYRLAYLASFVLVALLVIFVVQTDLGYITGLAPADQINPSFIQALSWMKNNTAQNSIVLTLWPDGSVVEGVANLTSVTDSVGSQYAFKANPFAAWLYNSSPNVPFLIANITGKPDYLLVRQSWMLETGGIFTESGINVSGANFGYNPFTSLNERVNKSAQVYQFFGSGLEEDTVITNATTGTTIASYLKFSQGIQPFEYVDFYNVLTGNWSIVRQTAFNVTNNQTFLIAYSPIPAPKLYVNITAAYMLGTQLAASNMVKFLFHCNAQACLWNNNAASLQLVYINQDTKIFKIVYNESNATVAAANYPRK